jgi:hypothetical protein
MSFNNTIKLVKKQRDVLVQAIQTIDDEFYTRRMTPEMQALRDALDKILNHSDELNEGSDMELTKIKFISPNYAYVKNAR